ncbi:NAD(P)H-dependent oxidoreductase subunit E [Breznakiella homolactica]|uniref:NAD(P)H-dependent oxidoreductase subunit E n=1 Tax=Breznakiella homolactica TaxID=2798577 RepID=A0A7T7XNV7_9SPIR|nr:NAD(P)H-dependent oxidoreductase subunit E [Breznakiella homolactica]QQO09688.1 NAD(P)H-dependent oxidoreductase subunit E [Breznakiella homolactica]
MTDSIVKVVVCSGTACYVMGGSELLVLDDHIPAKWKDNVQLEGAPCLGLCKDKKNGKAPFAEVDGTVVSQATIPEVLKIIAEKLGET